MSRFGGKRNFNSGAREERRREVSQNESRRTAFLRVPSSECGKIIGKGGSKIRELENTTQARLKVSRKDEPDGSREVEISGTEEAVQEAQRLIEDLVYGRESCHDNWDNDDDNGWSDRSPNNSYSRSQQHGVTRNRFENHVNRADSTQKDVIYIPSSDVGRIIGRGGSKIREIQEDCDCTVNVCRSSETNGMKKVELSGSEAAIEEARRLIEDLVGLGDSSSDSRRGAGGWSQGGSKDRFDRRDNDGDGFFGKGQPRGDARNREDNHVKEGDSFLKDVILVSSDDIGRIIGRAGSKIKEIQEDSDCTVKVSREEGDYGEVEVTLTGTKESIIRAKKMISRCGVSFSGGQIEEEKPRSGGIPATGFIDWMAMQRNHEEMRKKKFGECPPIIKDFYKEEDHIRDMHPEAVRQFRLEKNNIMVHNPTCPDMEIPNPVPRFEDCFRHYPSILREIEKQRFVEPSPIQCQAWPILMSGSDLIGIAQTGTGKTLAFLLPALIHIDGQTIPRAERKGPSMLVLCPTRELALQIQEEVEKFNYKGIKSVCVYGGGDRRAQIKAVKSGVEIIVATPGRLNDLVMNEIINLISVTYLVLDEADRMLDMGFEPDIRKSLFDIRPDRQTVMTSATWPREVEDLAKRYTNDPVHVRVGTMDLAAVHSVRQDVVFMGDDEKKDYLFEFLVNMQPGEKVIVFAGKKATVDDLSSDLTLKGVGCQSIHGDREQCDRIQALDDFKSGEVMILVATDVASRGLDVKDITHVLNYDFPRNIEEYVHRIGRTGRAGRTGQSITYLTRGDWRSAQQLINIMAEADQEIPQELMDMAERYKARQERDEQEGRQGGRGRGGRRFGGGGGGRRGGRDDGFFC